MSFFEISLFNIIMWAAIALLVSFYIERDRRSVAGGKILTIAFAVLGALAAGYLTSFISGKAMLDLSLHGLLNAALGAFFLTWFFRSSFGERHTIRTNLKGR